MINRQYLVGEKTQNTASEGRIVTPGVYVTEKSYKKLCPVFGALVCWTPLCPLECS